jgi:thymidine kinase
MAKLYFYYSAMNAGKSTMLLQSSYNYNERGMETLLFTPALDDRRRKGSIASRIGLEANAVAFDEQFDFLQHIKQAISANPNIRCVLLDEAQFLKKTQVKQLVDATLHLDIPVLAYGLRTDFTGEPFEGSKYLLAWAQTLVEIKTICHCGRKATMSMRIDAQGNKLTQGDTIEIGGNERYVATCRQHYEAGDSGPLSPANPQKHQAHVSCVPEE